MLIIDVAVVYRLVTFYRQPTKRIRHRGLEFSVGRRQSLMGRQTSALTVYRTNSILYFRCCDDRRLYANLVLLVTSYHRISTIITLRLCTPSQQRARHNTHMTCCLRLTNEKHGKYCFALVRATRLLSKLSD